MLNGVKEFLYLQRQKLGWFIQVSVWIDELGKVKEKLWDFRIWVSKKIWYGRNPDETLAKRFKLFLIVGISLIASGKFLSLAGFPIPNIEPIIPLLVIMGAFSLYMGRSEKWGKIRKYAGIIAIVSVFLIDLIFWGFHKIYLFMWPGFVMVMLIARKKDLSFFDRFSDIAVEATVTAAAAIILFDIFTAFGFWLLWRPLTIATLYGVYLAQIPFTLYHLGSLIFVPPVVGFGKMASKVKLRAPVATKAGEKVRQRR
ncbi:hypothetical protein AKJ65_06285 [candidate division MSBL1 archaeon SCGC-AAA259E19]|uniref:Uncharacterized protein n=1 Tax=candidate division MSBL1 archaeon SCGC-AAA259E19 TaxID=1698264 RepID=A0A133UH43_9EURY|nr:hypothetical protein AKJ65_06285 [candidate division MSBL1 archaeon SCGC-AAA259E19]